jgi:uncharacterized protein
MRIGNSRRAPVNTAQIGREFFQDAAGVFLFGNSASGNRASASWQNRPVGCIAALCAVQRYFLHLERRSRRERGMAQKRTPLHRESSIILQGYGTLIAMEEQRNTETVKQLHAVFGTDDIDGILRILAADVVWRYPGSAPWSGRRHGRDEVKEFFRALNESAETEQFDPAHYIAQGDMVVATGKERLRTRALGRTVTLDWAHVFTLREGKVILAEFYVDTAALGTGFEASPEERATQLGPMGVTEPPFGIAEPAPPDDRESDSR